MDLRGHGAAGGVREWERGGGEPVTVQLLHQNDREEEGDEKTEKEKKYENNERKQ